MYITLRYNILHPQFVGMDYEIGKFVEISPVVGIGVFVGTVQVVSVA